MNLISTFFGCPNLAGFNRLACTAVLLAVLGEGTPGRAQNWDPALTNGASGGGAGTWNATNANWYTGSADAVWNSTTATFGGTAGSVSVSGPLSATGLTFNTTAYVLSNANGTSSLTLTGTPTINVSTGYTTFNATLAGTNGFTKSGTGTLYLGGTNSGLSGTVTVTGGAIGVNSAAALGSASVSLNNSTSFTYVLTFGGSGMNVSNNISYNAAVKNYVANTGGNNTYSGVMSFAGTGGGGLASTAGNTLTVTQGIQNTGGGIYFGGSAYLGTILLNASGSGTGGARIDGGKVVVGAGTTNATGSGAITLNGGTLAGTGTVGAVVMNATTLGTTSFSVLAPGDIGTAGTLTAASLTWNGTAATYTTSLTFDIGANQAGSDELILTGALTKGTAGTFLFNFNDISGGASAGQTYTLISAGSIGGGFTASDFSASGLSGTFSIVGNSVDFTVAAVPEPSTYLLLGFGLGTIVLTSGRRGRRILFAGKVA